MLIIRSDLFDLFPVNYNLSLMQSNNVHSKLAHIKSIRTPTLQKMLEALEWSSETKCKKNCASASFEIGDIVELRREYYVSEIVRVQNLVRRGAETRF